MKLQFALILLLSLVISPRTFGQEISSSDQVEVIQLSEHACLLKVNSGFSANCLLIEGENGLNRSTLITANK